MKKFLSQRKPILALFVAIAILMIVGAGLTIKAYADGSAGSGGSSGGACTQNCPDYRLGWQLYDINGSGPEDGFKSTNTKWGKITNAQTQTSVQNTCKSYGIDQVWIFVEWNAYKANTTPQWMGYDYLTTFGQPENAANYMGTDAETVHAYYNQAIEQGITDTGLTWGKNVGWFCYTINPPWSLTVATTTNRTVAEPGDTIMWTHTVTNNGPSKTNVDVNWHYNNKGDLPGGSGGNKVFSSGQKMGASDTQTSTYVAQAADFGKKICRSTSASPSTHLNGPTIESTSVCVSIAKKPKVQVWGGDLNVGASLLGGTSTNSQVSTSVSEQDGKMYGSWAEYGVTATGSIIGFGAGAAYEGGLASYNACNVSELIFTNAGTGSCNSNTSIGHYSSVQSMPDIGAGFPISTSTPTYKNLGDSSLRRVETTTGTVTLPATTIDKGDWLVLNAPTATVNITGDINYTHDTLSSSTDIPQLIIIANCINIAGNVRNVDAWLIATGKAGTSSACDGVADGGVVNTCSDVVAGGNLSTKLCSNLLRVNGPVMARHLYMQRTSGATLNDAAETFNLRPDAYLWLAQRSITAGYIQSVSTIELPPRF